jgi:hypothetical protein
MHRRYLLQGLGGAISALSIKTGGKVPEILPQRHPLVGAWHLQAVGAPVLHHGLLFHTDGIVCTFQADGGYPQDSESDGAGEWEVVSKDQAKGAFLVFRYSRQTHEYLGFVRVELDVIVHGETLRGQAHSRVYDAQGNLLTEARPTLSATRITVN